MPNALGLPDEALTKRPSSLRELLSIGKVPHAPVLLEGAAWGPLAGQRVGLRSLSADALTRSAGAAAAWCCAEAGLDRRDLYTDVGSESLEIEYRVQVISRALVHAEDPSRPMVDGASDVRELLTPEQVTFLFERFLEFQQTRSPYEVLGDSAKIEELARDLGKGFRPLTSLRRYDAATLRAIITSLVNRPAKPTPPRSSDT